MSTNAKRIFEKFKNKKEKNTGRVGRDKKKKALESDEYIIAIGELAKRKILETLNNK